MSLDGKKALVTGGRRNIGRGIALALAQAGCDVGINDLERDADADRTLKLIRDQGREADFFQADISDRAQVEAMFTAFIARFNRLDILVNNPYAGSGATFSKSPKKTGFDPGRVSQRLFSLQSAGRPHHGTTGRGWLHCQYFFGPCLPRLARRYGLRSGQSGCAASHREHGRGLRFPQYPLQRRDAGVYGPDPYF